MITLLLAAALAADDSTVYPVLNHDRPAGSMVVARHGDTTTVRFVFTDRNRGTRLYSRYVMRDGRILSIENRPILADDRLGDPTFRFEILGDSIRQWTPARTTSEPLQRDVYYAIGFSPFDQVALVRYLLRQPTHTAKLPGNGTAHLEVVKELTVPVSRGTERVRLVSIDRAFGATPQMIWIDPSDNLFATEVSWFMTVKPGVEPALPTLRKTEFAVRDAQAEALNKRCRSRRQARWQSSTATSSTASAASCGREPRWSFAAIASSPSGLRTRSRFRRSNGHRRRGQDGHARDVGDARSHAAHQRDNQRTDATLVRHHDRTRPRVGRRRRGERARSRAGGRIAGAAHGPCRFHGGTRKVGRPDGGARTDRGRGARWVARYDSLGYRQIKVYNLVHPDLIPTIAAEAHARGMRLSGHIPRGSLFPTRFNSASTR